MTSFEASLQPHLCQANCILLACTDVSDVFERNPNRPGSVERISHIFPPNELPRRSAFENRIVRKPAMTTRIVAIGFASVAQIILSCGTFAEEKPSQPVYRVATDTPTSQPVAGTAATAA